MESVYPELNRIAARFMAGERASHTLDPGALVHELWFRMSEGLGTTVADRTHFFALAARSMRNILVDHARARAAAKRGGDRQRVSLSCAEGFLPIACDDELVGLHEALIALEQADERAARVVELRFFVGLEGRDIAALLGVSEITVKRDWRAARAWLLAQLTDDPVAVSGRSSA